jgi:hypothetical protein
LENIFDSNYNFTKSLGVNNKNNNSISQIDDSDDKYSVKNFSVKYFTPNS